MTDAELFAAADARSAALDAMPPGILGEMEPHIRAEADRLSAGFRRLDAAVVAELRRRGRPATWGGRQLRLARDRVQFAECDPATGRPLLEMAWMERIAMHDYERGTTR